MSTERMTLATALRARVDTFLRAMQANVRRVYSDWILSPPGGFTSRRGTLDWLNAYSQSPWIRAIVGQIASSTAANAHQIMRADESGRNTAMTRQGGSPWSVQRRMLREIGPNVTLEALCNPATLRAHLTRERRYRTVTWRGLSLRREPADVVEDHPAAAVLKKPNPDMSWYDLQRLTQVHYELAGNAYWIKERDSSGRVVELYPLAPHFVKSTPSRTMPWFWINVWGRMFPVPREEVVWFRDYDPANPYGQGTSTAMSLEDEVAADEMAAKYNARFFANDATPRIALHYEGDMTDAQAEAARTRWTDRFRNFWNAHKPAIVYGSLKEIKILSSSMKDMDFKNLRENSRDIMMGAWAMPGVLLGRMQDFNRNNAEAALYQWGLTVLAPRLVGSAQTLDRDLLSEWADEYPDAWLEYEDPVSRDVERDAKLGGQGFGDSVLTVNQYLEALGQPPLEGSDGDLFRVPAGGGRFVFVASLETGVVAQAIALLPGGGPAEPEPSVSIAAGPSLPALPPAKPKPALPPPEEDEDERNQVSPEHEGFKKDPRFPVPEPAPQLVDGGRNRRTAWYDGLPSSRASREIRLARAAKAMGRAIVRDTEPLEKQFGRALKPVFDAQEEEFRGRLYSHMRMWGVYHRGINADDISDILGDEDLWKHTWQKQAEQAGFDDIEEALLRGGSQGLRFIGADLGFDLKVPRVSRLLQERPQRFAQEVNETTWQQLKGSLVQGTQQGETLGQLETRICDVMDLARGPRTENIARTEMAGAYNRGILEGYHQGGVERKWWYTTGDGRVRDDHYELGEKYDEAHAIPVEEEFEIHGHRALCPGSFGDPGMDCQCFVDPQVPVYTTDGWRPIGSIRPGDLVLTDKGRFRRVSRTLQQEQPGVSYGGDVIRIHVDGTKRVLTVTPEHPVQTQRGWIPAQDVLSGDVLYVIAKLCPECQVVMVPLLAEGTGRKEQQYCSTSCRSRAIAKGQWAREEHRANVGRKASQQMQREYASGTRNRATIALKANARTRELVAAGQSSLQRFFRAGGDAWYRQDGEIGMRQHMYEMLHANLRAMHETHYTVSSYETVLFEGLRDRGIACEQQYLILDYCVDLAIPAEKIVIECDGHWHKLPQVALKDRVKDARLVEAGYTVLRFNNRRIQDDLRGCVDAVARLLANHDHEYLFMPCQVTCVERKPLAKTHRLHNLAVEEDESYVAAGFAVHNCRCVSMPVLGPSDDEDEADESRRSATPRPFPEAGFQTRFDPDQPRRPNGQFGSGGALSAPETGGGTGGGSKNGDDDEKASEEKDPGGELLERLEKRGGFTYNPRTKTFATEGLAVSPFPEAERMLESKSVTRQDIADYFREHGDKLYEPGAHLGGWVDHETGKTYLDISIIAKTHEEAEAIAHKHGQEGYYDLKTGETIIVKSDEDRRREANHVCSDEPSKEWVRCRHRRVH